MNTDCLTVYRLDQRYPTDYSRGYAPRPMELRAESKALKAAVKRLRAQQLTGRCTAQGI